MVSSASRARFLIIATVGFLVSFTGAQSAFSSARDKFERIETEQLPPGSSVNLTEEELTEYAREQAEVVAPGAVREARLRIVPAGAEAWANINLLRVRQAQGKDTNWLLEKMLEGERPVHVRVRMQSSGGKARVDVERVEISGIAMEGSTLDFVIDRFVIPNFPDAKVGRWFKLDHGIDRIDLTPGKATVRIGKGH
jgi:hypothetical protein